MGKPSRRSRQREHRVSKLDMEILEHAEKATHMWQVSCTDVEAVVNDDQVSALY